LNQGARTGRGLHAALLRSSFGFAHLSLWSSDGSFASIGLFVLLFGMVIIPLRATAAPSTKPRLIMLADMGNEPDEEQQNIHLMVCANEIDIEGLIVVTGKYLNENYKDEFHRHLHPELYLKIIDGYEKVLPNLKLNAAGWPEPAYLRSVVVSGQSRYGLADVGEGKSSAGSKLIIAAAEKDDPRPLRIVINAGANTLAQALWDYRATHTAEQLEKFITKFRVFENGAQDNTGAWICREFPAIHWTRSNNQTYSFMDTAGPYVWQPYPRTSQGQHRWAEEHIMRDHGALGALYPYRFEGNMTLEGGGTIPFMGLVNKGLYDMDQPSWGGWSGRFTITKQKNVWSRHAEIHADEEKYGDFFCYTEATDNWTDPESGVTYTNRSTPVWRWRRAMLNDEQARFDWCVKPFAECNHHPVAAFNGDKSSSIIQLKAKPGKTISLNASASTDPDKDKLDFNWYVYPEAGTYTGAVTVKNSQKPKAKVTIPKDAAGRQIHVILQINDENKAVSLYAYRRVVIDVASN
jgi:hypothetical protein